MSDINFFPLFLQISLQLIGWCPTPLTTQKTYDPHKPVNCCYNWDQTISCQSQKSALYQMQSMEQWILMDGTTVCFLWGFFNLFSYYSILFKLMLHVFLFIDSIYIFSFLMGFFFEWYGHCFSCKIFTHIVCSVHIRK